MPSSKAVKSSTSTTDFQIKNKHRRSSHNVAIRAALAKAKRKARFDRKKQEERLPELRRRRLQKNIPQTLDSKRVAVDKPWEPSDELLQRAKKAREEAEGDMSSEELTEEGDEEPSTEEAAEKSHPSRRSRMSTADEEDDTLDFNLDDEDEKMDSDDSISATKKPSNPKLASSSDAEIIENLLYLIPRPSAPPKTLLTTTRIARRHDLYQTLSYIFPNTSYIPRGRNFTLPQISKFATNRGYTHLLVGIEDSKNLHGLIVIILPAGPTFHFSLTSYADGKAIEGRGKNTNHVPELILNNFTTPIGKLTATLFQSIYPQQPDFRGRQVVTLHNQRDYIFFRMHRYVFRDTDVSGSRGSGDKTTGAEKLGLNGQKAGADLGIRVGLQELGPRFTLKLRRVERGVCEGVEWEWKGKMEKNRKMFYL